MIYVLNRAASRDDKYFDANRKDWHGTQQADSPAGSGNYKGQQDKKRHLSGCLKKKYDNFFISFLYKQENVRVQKPWKEPVAVELLSPI